MLLFHVPASPHPHCTAGTDGGGVYALSAELAVATSDFRNNTAARGAGVAAGCVAEVCVGQLPRDTCDAQTTALLATSFAANAAGLDGGGVYVWNHALDLGTAGSVFEANVAARGASVFAEPSATVLVNGVSEGDGTNPALGLVVGDNRPLAYGVGVASLPDEAEWQAPPTALSAAMAGASLCGVSECVATLRDAFGNTVTTPTVVEIVATSIGAVVDGPQYLLVADGRSAPIASLGIRVTGDAAAIPASVDLTFGFRLVGAPNVTAALTATATPCEPGWGAVGDVFGGWTCAECEAGSYSAAMSWEACRVCEAGTVSVEAGATSCNWCVAGYGWDAAAEACAVCTDGSFSPEETLVEACQGCLDEGLGDGATECAAPLATAASSTPWWVWLAIGLAVIALVACVGAIAWRSSRRKVISHCYIGMVRGVDLSKHLFSLRDVVSDRFSPPGFVMRCCLWQTRTRR